MEIIFIKWYFYILNSAFRINYPTTAPRHSYNSRKPKNLHKRTSNFWAQNNNFCSTDNISAHHINLSISFHACSKSFCATKCIVAHKYQLFRTQSIFARTELNSVQVYLWFCAVNVFLHNTRNSCAHNTHFSAPTYELWEYLPKRTAIRAWLK